ncbi:MAG: hypothetical protein HYT03_02305 [Candidatus Harrisonbacteria bacterium]|nr:hypothetical protein [Candidatus Harrisonbacteria bacterium]
MKKISAIFYTIGGTLAVLLTVYIGILIGTLVKGMSVITQADLIKPIEVASFNLEKFESLNIGE